jgi:hypothetical protein
VSIWIPSKYSKGAIMLCEQKEGDQEECQGTRHMESHVISKGKGHKDKTEYQPVALVTNLIL